MGPRPPAGAPDRRSGGGASARGADRRSGQVLPIFAISLALLMGAAGLAIDMGRFYAERRFLQNAADAAALAAGTALIDGATNEQAEAVARDVLEENYAIPPNGIEPGLPPDSEVYVAGHAGDPTYLLDGILVTTSGVRVAVRNTIPYTFGRAVGLDASTVTAQARVAFTGSLLPIAVRRYIHAPGNGTGVAPCTDDPTAFMDFFATANTACVGTDASAAGRTEPSAGQPFNSANPDNDRGSHGPIVAILGQGADPENGADFRGFIALDIRNFQTPTSQLYYNGITPTTAANTLKDFEAGWIIDSYPGPMLPAATIPPDFNDQVAVMSGNSAGIAVDAVARRFAPGDEVMVAVYPGVTMQIPDFSLSSPGTLDLPQTGTVARAGSLRVSRNNDFTGTVTLSTVVDGNDPTNPLLLGTLVDGGSPFDYTPTTLTPSAGAGTTVLMENVVTNGAEKGIYSLWLRGQAGAPYFSVKYVPFAVEIGNVNRDFTVTSDKSEAQAISGGSVTITLNLRRLGSAFGNTVGLSLEPMPGVGALPAGMGAHSFTPAAVTVPAGGSGVNSTLTINTGTMAPGLHDVVVRATGVNSDGQRVTRLLTLTILVSTSETPGTKEYVDIVGFAIMRIVTITSNSVTAYAITPVIPDPADFRLRLGQEARLSPWK